VNEVKEKSQIFGKRDDWKRKKLKKTLWRERENEKKDFGRIYKN